MYLMRQSLQEYSNDNKLDLNFEQITEISISNAGSEASIYQDYMKTLSTNNKSTVAKEEKAFKKRVDSLISSKKSD